MVVKFSKSQYRDFAKQRLKSIVNIRAKSYSRSVNFELLRIIKQLKPKNILLFIPLNYEPNLISLRYILQSGRKLLTPFMANKSLKMVELRLPFRTSKFGVREPSSFVEFRGRIDLAVVPVIGVDGSMARIGHGKGFYDMFFSSLAYKPVIIFVQIDDLFTKDIICEEHDISCDFYITPRKTYAKKGFYDRNFYRARSRSGRSWRWVSCNKKDKRR